MQNVFQFIDQISRPSLSLDVADVAVAVMNPVISEAMKSTVDASIGGLSTDLMEEVESRLGSFAQCFSEENGATVEQAVKEAHCENSTCQRKGNWQQLDHKLEVLDKSDAATSALKNKYYDKVKAAWRKVSYPRT